MSTRARGGFRIESFVSSMTTECIVFWTIRCIHAVLLVLFDVLQKFIEIVVDFTVVVIHRSPMIGNLQLRRLEIYTGEQTVLIDGLSVIWSSGFTCCRPCGNKTSLKNAIETLHSFVACSVQFAEFFSVMRLNVMKMGGEICISE